MKTLKEIGAGIIGAFMIWAFCWLGAIMDIIFNG